MDVTTIGMFIGVFAILLGIFGLMWQMNRQSNRLEDAIDTQGKELRAEMKEQGTRVSQAELDQARLSGVNSVLLRHTHIHESLGDAD